VITERSIAWMKHGRLREITNANRIIVPKHEGKFCSRDEGRGRKVTLNWLAEKLRTKI
jgi:hypothetical protein